MDGSGVIEIWSLCGEVSFGKQDIFVFVDSPYFDLYNRYLAFFGLQSLCLTKLLRYQSPP